MTFDSTDLRAISADFLRKAASGDAEDAFARYASPTFRHHNPYFRSDAESLMRAMQENAARNPDKKLVIQHVLQEGEMVAVHSCVKMNPEGKSIALVHLFRFAEGRIEELWDIGQPEPEEMINEHGMF